MVAVAGTGWVLAPSLVAYVLEADRYYPQRDRSADGSIGDLAHQARESDHNPDDGYVHAVDLDEDLAPGLDLERFADRLLTRRDPRIKYVIYEGRFYKSYVSSSGPAWMWLPYSGVNAHLHHLHLSILHTDAARNDTRSWGFSPTSTESDDLSMADLADILAAIDLADDRNKKRYDRLAADVAEIRGQIGDDKTNGTMQRRFNVILRDVVNKPADSALVKAIAAAVNENEDG